MNILSAVKYFAALLLSQLLVSVINNVFVSLAKLIRGELCIYELTCRRDGGRNAASLRGRVCRYICQAASFCLRSAESH